MAKRRGIKSWFIVSLDSVSWLESSFAGLLWLTWAITDGWNSWKFIPSWPHSQIWQLVLSRESQLFSWPPDHPTSSRPDADLGQCSKRVSPSAQVLYPPKFVGCTGLLVEPKADRELHRGKNTGRQFSLGAIKSNNLTQIWRVALL